MLKDQKLIVVIVLALVVLGLNAYVSYYATKNIVDNERRVSLTLEVMNYLESLRALSIANESSMRGFVLTGDNFFINDYEQDKAQTFELIQNIRNRTSDNPLQQQQINKLETYIQEKFLYSDEAVKRRWESGYETAKEFVASGKGKGLMKEINSTAETMIKEETNLLNIRQEQSADSIRTANFSFAVTTILASLLLFGVYYFFSQILKERRNSEDALRIANEKLESTVAERTLELERSNRELQDFAFVASHDLQEPLRKIQAFGDRLKLKYRPELGAQGTDYLNRMQNAAERMSRLITDLLTFSRVSTHTQPFQPINLNQTVDEVLSDLEVRIQQTAGKVEVGELPEIAADPLQMRQLFQNLIGNALKFHRPEEPPIIHIIGEILNGNANDSEDLTATVPQCQIIVSDNGIGFDESYVERIFTPFQRLHNKNEYEGTGMGLAVCRKIVERHNGTIIAKSTPGQGSQFIINLPIN
ncbi:MAG: CHASE3 domain-containing protein [Acidobacteriota bacterium]